MRFRGSNWSIASSRCSACGLGLSPGGSSAAHDTLCASAVTLYYLFMEVAECKQKADPAARQVFDVRAGLLAADEAEFIGLGGAQGAKDELELVYVVLPYMLVRGFELYWRSPKQPTRVRTAPAKSGLRRSSSARMQPTAQTSMAAE